MVLVNNVALAMICCIYCCICWGSWANTQKMVQKKDWQSFLFYWDYIAGLFVTAVLGLLLFNGGHLFENLSWSAVLWPLLGGVIWNFSNIFLTAANGVAGMAVGFPIGGGLGWVGGIIFNYFSSGFTGNKPLLWTGVVLAVAAMVLCAVSYRRLTTSQKKSPLAGIIFAIISGFGFAFFYGLVVKGTAPNFGGVATLSPYQAVFFFAVAVLISTFLFCPVAMRYSVEGRVTMKDYFQKGDARTHLIGMLGGFIWMSGMVISFMTAQAPVNKAVSYALSNASPLIAMIWGVLIWREFKDAPKGTMKYVYAMFLCFLAALVIIAASN
ncbi:MAG: multidrug DMT transporter permease [Bacteroidales bacterium]|jgi:glucose uptake protein|nr:multidrug DMT transporter permease [Bacteroidales bacterium]